MREIKYTNMDAASFSKLPETNLPTELINGEVIMTHAPTDLHQVSVFEFAKLIERIGANGRGRISSNDVYLDALNIVQPDVFWIKEEESGCLLGAIRFV